MTVIFANKDTLLVDNVGTNNDFGVFTKKLNEYTFRSDRSFDHSKTVMWCCAGCPNTGDEIVYHYDHGSKMLGKLRDTIVFMYDSTARRTYRICAAEGEIPVAVPMQASGLTIWGDGQGCFMQVVNLLEKELIQPDKFGDIYAALWLGDTSRVNHVPCYSGWLDSSEFNMEMLKPMHWERLAFLSSEA